MESAASVEANYLASPDRSILRVFEALVVLRRGLEGLRAQTLEEPAHLPAERLELTYLLDWMTGDLKEQLDRSKEYNAEQRATKRIRDLAFQCKNARHAVSHDHGAMTADEALRHIVDVRQLLESFGLNDAVTLVDRLKRAQMDEVGLDGAAEAARMTGEPAGPRVRSSEPPQRSAASEYTDQPSAPTAPSTFATVADCAKHFLTQVVGTTEDGRTFGLSKKAICLRVREHLPASEPTVNSISSYMSYIRAEKRGWTGLNLPAITPRSTDAENAQYEEYLATIGKSERIVSKYAPLQWHLTSVADQGAGVWRATFGEVETTLGQRLPPAAYAHAAWWSNTKSHSHAKAWLNAGWRTQNVDMAAKALTFVRPPK